MGTKSIGSSTFEVRRLLFCLTDSYLRDLYLKGCLWVAEVRPVMFEGFVSPIEAIATLVAVPVSSFDLFCSFD